MRKLKLWNYNKTEYVDLNDERFFATDLKGLGLDYDLAFNDSTNGRYLDNLKVKDNDISSKIKFANYKAYDDFRAFVLRNGKQPFILEYTTEKITTTHRIELSQEDIDIDELDDEYFIRVKNVVQKYGLKRDTVKYTTNAMYPELTKDKYAEIVLLEGKTVEQDGELLSVKNPVIESVGKNLFDGAWEVGGYSLDDGTPINESDRIRSLNFTKVKPQQTYSINLEFSNASRAFYFDVNKQFIGYTNNARVFTTPNNCHYVKFVDHITDINKQHMLNLGSTPLPYEPYRSTELQFNGIYHKWDKIINDGGVYYDEIGSVEIKLWEFKGSIVLDGDLINTYRFRMRDFETENNILLLRDTTLITTFDYGGYFDDNRHYHVSSSSSYLFINVEKELIDQQSGTTLEDKLKSYLQENNITGVFQLATPTRKPTTYEGGIELFPDSNLFVTDDNNLLDTVELKYKPWNWSNVITKTNLRKYTVGGNDLVIYLPKSYVEHLDGETDEEKIQKYFADKYVEMLLANYIIDNEPIYRDVYVSRLSKGELDRYGILESDLLLKPKDPWHRETKMTFNDTGSDIYRVLNITNNGMDDMPVNIKIKFNHFDSLTLISIAEDDIYYVQIFEYIGHIFVGQTLLIDSVNQKIYIDHTNAYHIIEKSMESFIYLPPGETELTMYLAGENIDVDIEITCREAV